MFGLPFITVLVTSSFALSSFTQTRYDLRDDKVSSVTKEQELGMKKGRRKFDVREEYYRLQSTDKLGENDEWDNKRVERLPGQKEWGELPIAKKS
ncbi:Cytochrome oxidase assembly [Microbotryomycetes sp. JL221]|nr:Cytochrome oxidase assembly [Microbotryomycetes sp. JL221]